jgi:hypothetical protein
MTFAILGILWLQKWGIPFATLSYSILQKTGTENRGEESKGKEVF